MTQKQIRSFDFSKLPKLSERHLLTVDALLRLYPQFSEENFASGWTEAFQRDLGLPLQLSFVAFEEADYAAFIGAMTQPSVVVQLVAQPSQQAVLLELDAHFCRLLVERTLGSSEKNLDPSSPWTPLEEGLFDFLIAKALAQLGSALSFQGPALFRVGKIFYEPKSLPDLAKGDTWGCVLKFYLGFEQQGTYVRIYLPHPLVEGVFLREDLARDVESEAELEKRLHRVSHIKTVLWSEIGRVSLMASEKAQLEKGDVVLFDDSPATWSPQGLSGKTILRVGEMPSEGLLAEVIDTEHKMVVKILDFLGGD